MCGLIVIRQNWTTEFNLEQGWFGRSLSSNDVVVKRLMSVMTYSMLRCFSQEKGHKKDTVAYLQLLMHLKNIVITCLIIMCMPEENTLIK